MRSHDVAIYAPRAAFLYMDPPIHGGGAERQMMLLAQELAAAGVRVAHIVLPVAPPVQRDGPAPRLVTRGAPAGSRPLGRMLEFTRIWRGLEAADAAVYVVRTSAPAVGVAAMFCQARRRKLLFSASSNFDFTFHTLRDRRHRRELYSYGVRHADAVVVQSREQRELAALAFPGVQRVTEIASFAELAAPAATEPTAFLWLGTLVDYKQPLQYVALARTLPEARFVMLGVEPVTPSTVAAEVREQARGVENLELLEARPHAQAMELVDRAVAVVNTSPAEGMPNVFLEAWARGVPALSLEFDPDGRIAQRGLGVAAGGSWERFVAGARELWAGRGNRAELARRTRAYIEEVHSSATVTERWLSVLRELEAPL